LPPRSDLMVAISPASSGCSLSSISGTRGKMPLERQFRIRFGRKQNPPEFGFDAIEARFVLGFEAQDDTGVVFEARARPNP